MAHNDTHAARKKGGAGKILLVVLLLLLLAAGAAVRFAYNEIHGNGAPGSTEVIVSICLLYTSPSPRDLSTSRMPSSA